MQRLPYKLAQNDLEFILCELSGRLKKKKIINYLARQDNPDYMKIAKYLNDNKVNVFPYKFTEQYKSSDISIKKDKTSNLYFTNYHNFDIYLKPAFTNKYRAARYFKNILLEQDTQSPHRYTTEEFHPQKDSVILDIGGAEGFFPIDYIDAVKKVYIFECSNEWIQALEKTYFRYAPNPATASAPNPFTLDCTRIFDREMTIFWIPVGSPIFTIRPAICLCIFIFLKETL